jgi:signal transduction histidine kinase
MIAGSAAPSGRTLLTAPDPNRPLSGISQRLLHDYGIALLAIALAIALRLLMTPWLGARVPYITLFPAVAVAVWYGGYRPALVATLLGYFVVDYLIVDSAPVVSGGPSRLVAFSAYFISCVIIIAFGDGMNRSKTRLLSSEVGLQRQVEALTKLHELSLRLAVTEDLPAALSVILKTLVGIHRASFGLLSLYDPATGDLNEAASVGFETDGRQSTERIMPGAHAGAHGRAFTMRRRVVVADVETDPDSGSYRAAARELAIRAVHSTPILTRSGDILGVMSVYFSAPREPDDLETQFSDMCARHAAEAIEARRYKQALQESEQKLRLQAADLEQQLIASGRLVSVGEITASLAHEFNNPLGVMMGFAQDLRSEKHRDHPDYRPLSIIYEEGKRCEKIVADLLEFSRPQKAELKEMRPRESIDKALSFVRARLYGQKIDVNVEVPPDVPTLIADPVQIEQVLVNLFLNAIDAMPQGGTLSVRAAHTEGPAGERVQFTITDTGDGIAEESLRRIFQPFFTEKKRTGMGLGLPICKRIVQNHGGTIAVASEVAKGTTFTICLPLRRTETD